MASSIAVPDNEILWINDNIKNCYTNNYMKLIPDSQYFTNLEQILNYVKMHSNDKYLEVAIKNTIKEYKLIKNDATSQK